MRVIFDSSVLISAILRINSVPSRSFFKALREHTILTSPAVLEELKKKFPNRKFDRYADLEARIAFLIKFEKRARIVKIRHRVEICRDPKDNKYLELALSGKADCIVTGDKDLLVLSPFEGIPIITPRNFIDNINIR